MVHVRNVPLGPPSDRPDEAGSGCNNGCEAKENLRVVDRHAHLLRGVAKATMTLRVRSRGSG